ncbi:hypothetical protein COCSUDRAFT_43861 [Coccomyxa subellipsoidea C-169]|uniref:Uncharacterized protein n=1 Tax=Coccomyxa subellipsoidea (strain C-169) TaxID=574566 RepID=I0YPU5_COCSC|nr:hypothetical protein COCSUDRAFT_43861 [Coccomyxa subellipsoidea C-169]EIE20414.1 hypothetical protein COCSUDRAFT_43861 [Coccomyxa subellipsoidea C-169]|eukprot:XP_005644958.1 hypothetical protein COCSUDRAFT_43861 [Coccomyxa subellipsoidea C-169]
MTALPVELSLSVGQLPDLFPNSVQLLRMARSGFLHLDAKTGPDAEIELLDKASTRVGHLKFHMDTHGYLLERPVTTAIRAEVPAGVEVLHTEILETGEVDAPNTPPAKAAASMQEYMMVPEGESGPQEYVMVSEGESGPVCGSRMYTVVEDRPVEMERHTTILEHHKWEKTFVIETRCAGERELSDQARVEVVSRTERVIAVAKADPYFASEQGVRGRQPYAIFQIGYARFHTGPLKDPGRAALWPGTHSTTGFSFDECRELFAAVYDKAAVAGQTLIGMGQQKLDASTGTKGCVKLQQADGKPIGQLSFDLDTHGYDFTRPEVWKIVRGFGTVSDWMAPVGLERISSTLLPGSIEGQLGALRRVCFGEMGFVEQLDGLDDDHRIIKWRVISHPLNTNPFPGSFLNYKAKIRLRDVTISTATFLEIEAEFDTEHTSAEAMRRELTARHEASIRGLLTLLSAKPAQQANVQAMLASLPLGAGGSVNRSGGSSSGVPYPSGIASAPMPNAATVLPNGTGVMLPNGQVALIPDIAKMSVSNPGNSGGQSHLVNSLGNSTGGVSVNNSGGVDLSASLATSRVLASNNLAAQQALADASKALHQQHLSAQAQLAGGLLPGGAPLPGVLPGGIPSGGSLPGMLPGSLPGVLPGALPGVLPQAAHPNAIFAAQAGAGIPGLSGGFSGPEMGPRDLRTANSYNSYTSNESLGSIRGNALGQALHQVQAGLLPDQVAALQALQKQHNVRVAASDGRASFESNDARFRAPEQYVSNSGGSAASFTAASPPRLSPRSIEKAKTILSGGIVPGVPPAAAAAGPATLDATGRVTSF